MNIYIKINIDKSYRSKEIFFIKYLLYYVVRNLKYISCFYSFISHEKLLLFQLKNIVLNNNNCISLTLING